jgi:two-component system, LuxR family, response regulator FixJ
MSAKLAVCVIDDDADLRGALKMLFKSRNIPYLSFGTAGEFFEGYTQKNVGCVLLDLKMPGTSGIEILREMRRRNILVPVILLTGHANVPVTVEAMKEGVLDLIEKPVDDDEVLTKVQAAFAKAEHFRNLASERQAVAPKIESLTPREIQVLDLMVAGIKNRKIAADLGISPKTLDIHRANILRKMQTKTIADLVRWRMVSRADDAGVMPVIVRA